MLAAYEQRPFRAGSKIETTMMKDGLILKLAHFVGDQISKEKTTLDDFTWLRLE